MTLLQLTFQMDRANTPNLVKETKREKNSLPQFTQSGILLFTHPHILSQNGGQETGCLFFLFNQLFHEHVIFQSPFPYNEIIGNSVLNSSLRVGPVELRPSNTF